MLAPGVLNDLTRIVLTNAIYFKAAWNEPFKPENTKDELFTIAPGKQISVPMMKGGTYSSNYAVLGDVKLLELLYRGYQSMIIVVPQQVDGLAKLERQLTPSLLKQWLTELYSQGSGSGVLSTWLPKFKIGSGFKLKQALSALGMPSAFNRYSDFSGMNGGPLPLFLTDVVHKAFVDVNEFGTEAAAATAVIAGVRSTRGEIRVDRPFLLLIRDLISGSILFIGRVVNPLG